MGARPSSFICKYPVNQIIFDSNPGHASTRFNTIAAMDFLRRIRIASKTHTILKRWASPPPAEMNPYLNIFPDSFLIGAKQEQPINWNALGIQSTYIIFITGRCGSTLLTNLVKDTGLAGAPEEFFGVPLASKLNQIYQARTATDYLRHVAKNHSSGGFFGLEIAWHHLLPLQQILDFPMLFPAGHARYFYMTRRDIVAQAWSFATAKGTGIWQVHSKKDNSHLSNKQPELDDKTIWKEILLILQAEKGMEQFFRRHHLTPTRIDYEMLISGKQETLGRLLLDLGCCLTSTIENIAGLRDYTLKMDSNNLASILKFRQNYAQLIRKVEDCRGSHYDHVSKSLRETGLLD